MAFENNTGCVMVRDLNDVKYTNEMIMKVATATPLQSLLTYKTEQEVIRIPGMTMKMEKVGMQGNNPQSRLQKNVYAREITLSYQPWHLPIMIDRHTQAIAARKGLSLGDIDQQVQWAVGAAVKNVECNILYSMFAGIQSTFKTIEGQTSHTHYGAVATAGVITFDEVDTIKAHFTEHGTVARYIFASQSSFRLIRQKYALGAGFSNGASLQYFGSKPELMGMNACDLGDGLVLVENVHIPAGYCLFVGDGLGRPCVAYNDLIPIKVWTDNDKASLVEAELWHDYAMALVAHEQVYALKTSANSWSAISESDFTWLGLPVGA